MPATDIQTLTDPIDIYGALRRLVLMNEDVTLTFQGDPTPYLSRLTHAELKSRSFFMDDLRPAEGNEKARQGTPFSIQCERQGVSIQFNADGRLRYQPELHQYRAEFPSQLSFQQRRGAYRINVPAAHQLVIAISEAEAEHFQEPQLTGVLLDLSETGFKARFKGDIRQRFTTPGELDLFRCSLKINSDTHLDCALDCRHLILDQQGDTPSGQLCNVMAD
ncbi:MAG: flagellar brake protein, partial [Oceanobacter sp.]